MATITGTTAQDFLVGTAFDDILIPAGTTSLDLPDNVSGGDGADAYQLSATTSVVHSYIFDDNGTDGAFDQITGAGALYHSASLGYSAWATAVRIGNDLFLHLPGKPYRFRDPAKPSFDIQIKDQYAGEAIEQIVAGGVAYALVTSNVGTNANDIMAGKNSADTFSALDGDDWVFGNGGSDSLDLGSGNDVAFGGNGKDTITSGAGNDRVFGDAGNDIVYGDAGADWIEGGAGRDKLMGGADSDRLVSDNGNDLLDGGDAADVLIGSAGNDRLIGGKGGDTYQFSSDGTASWGHDRIIDRGEKSSWSSFDKIELYDFYGPSSGNSAEAYARLSFARDGLDMVLTADDGLSTITVVNMFKGNGNKFAIDEITFNGAYWEPLRFKVLDGQQVNIGDDRDYANLYGGELNEVLFGTNGDDLIFGNAGTNFVWTGNGADTLIYKENDGANLGRFGGGQSHDIVEDFDISQDKLDFTEMPTVTSLADLTIGEDFDGDATISWSSGTWEISSIAIELRGVAKTDVTADLFVFA
ncbi:MAG: hypothetical protein KDJ19_09435 [Hyphomicrobiaceae bacterium]|nr:hypothetical protein [Hyphomicrobiaceae bacterium]MCC0023459.1 hypothetical protein [Hyphomicrobiaceae bacterium]